MIEAYAVADVRAAEADLMARVPPGTLMDRAATGLALACAGLLRERRGRVVGSQVRLLVGSGDNGGDALYAGALLARRGAEVRALLLDPDKSHAGGAAALRSAGGRCLDGRRAPAAVRADLFAADLVVDGIVGIGGRPGLRPGAAALAEGLRHAGVTVVATDLPSGIDPDTGECPGAHVQAHTTVTFGCAKPGLLVDPGAAATGRLVVVDIGLGPALAAARPAVTALDGADVGALLPRVSGGTDKYRRGVVGVLAGSVQYPGAAVLCTGAAVQAGAGMVRFVGPARPTDLVHARWPEVVAGRGRVQAWVVGPGFGSDPTRVDELVEALRDGVPTVLDADGLALLEGATARLATLPPLVLTPHAGEAARLLGVGRADVEAHRLAHARLLARRLRATVLLKGRTTLVAQPAGAVQVNRTGTHDLATAGTGDVLAGLVGALLAGGLGPAEAAAVAAYVHGRAGTRAARSGPPSAQDVLAALGPVLTSLRTGLRD